eukprot:TRINITY_DN32627_c0_g1_i1.p1 TRINITY_DN32627_c0_g1~~TRINITY_DN32627_c0_g1_i1.p1  ORF type:complete len:443 (+),score=49.65 TRINITY_DN32627_c0_g1_i1:52-1329(+)
MEVLSAGAALAPPSFDGLIAVHARPAAQAASRRAVTRLSAGPAGLSNVKAAGPWSAAAAVKAGVLALASCAPMLRRAGRRKTPRSFAGTGQRFSARMQAVASRLAEAAPQSPDMTCLIWSFNLRTEFQEEADGPNGWPQRRQDVASFIRQRMPAIICTQEATAPMLDYLLAELGEERYQYVGTSRSLVEGDEMAAIIFDSEACRLVDRETVWLGPTDAKRGVACWDAAFPRTVESAIFRLTASSEEPPDAAGTMVHVLNTHMDHVGVQARVQSAAILRDLVATVAASRPACAHIICGDFNSPKGNNEVYDLLLAEDTKLVDAARKVKVEAMPAFTIHKFAGLEFRETRGDGTVDLSAAAESAAPDAQHIDWVLYRSAGDGSTLLQPLRYHVLTEKLECGLWPSDHFPISVMFRVSLGSSSLRSKL